MSSDAQQNLTAPTERKDLVTSARTDLVAFEEFMLSVLDEWGLPTNNIVVSAGDRHVLLKNTPGILGELDAKQLATSPYVSKMILAGAAGLFDAALSYLWDETITQLRDRVADFDVAYFFDLAEADPARQR
ncbi:hypothetical protein [Streptomyces sp. NPDC059278]|uniref:hypothetical protein n=1 Tax=Streptomyces sp. NPDC059278 TaxID=3346801 RepID=UPI00367F86D6